MIFKTTIHKRDDEMNEHDLKLYRGIANERDQLQKDCGFLLVTLNQVLKNEGIDLDDEDQAILHQINADWKLKQ